MAVDFEAQVHLADLRARVLRREPITALEYRDLLLDLRRGRDMATANAPARPRLDLDALFTTCVASLQETTPTTTPNEDDT